MNEHWNPRVLAWLAAAGLTTADIARPSGEDVRLVTVDGERNLWTVHYAIWIRGKWGEWAAGLGHTGSQAAAHALLAGHTQDEFDAWLTERGNEA